jgi:hypothetical protein
LWAGGNPIASAIQGRYFTLNGLCWFEVSLTVGTNGGGTGPLTISLPVKASAAIDQQQVICKTYCAAGDYPGFARIDANGLVAYPYFPESPTVARHARWQSCSAGGAPGTGVPLMTGQYTLGAGNNFMMNGWYAI